MAYESNDLILINIMICYSTMTNDMEIEPSSNWVRYRAWGQNMACLGYSPGQTSSMVFYSRKTLTQPMKKALANAFDRHADIIKINANHAIFH